MGKTYTIRNVKDVDFLVELKRRTSESSDLRRQALEALAGEQVRPELQHALAPNPEADQIRELTPEQKDVTLFILETRFTEKHEHYQLLKGVSFADVKKALEANPSLIYSLSKMEETGGMPDIIAVESDDFVFGDCSAESPSGRRNCVYDRQAQNLLEQDGEKCDGNALDMSKSFGVDMMPEKVYREMQKTGKLDLNSLSWLKTPSNIREVGRALLGNRHRAGAGVRQSGAHGRGADRGWRGVLRVPRV